MKFKKFTDEFEKASAELRTIRGHIQALKVEITAVERALLPREETIAALDRTFDAMEARPSVGILAFASPHGPEPTLAEFEALIVRRYLRPRVRPEMIADLDRELEKQPPGLPKEGRAERLLELKNELLQAEREEEEFIEAAGAAGLKMARRSDADPKAVLACGAP